MLNRLIGIPILKRKQRVVVLIDYENLAFKHSEKLEFLFTHPNMPKGIISVRAYANFRNLDKVQDLFNRYRITPVQMLPFARNGKNAADMQIVIDAMEWVYKWRGRKRVDHFVLVSGDGDFIPLYRKLVELGFKITVFGNRTTTNKYLDIYSKSNAYSIPDFSNKKKGKVLVDQQLTDDAALTFKSLLTAISIFQESFHISLLKSGLSYLLESNDSNIWGFRGLESLVDFGVSNKWLRFDRSTKVIVVLPTGKVKLVDLGVNISCWIIHYSIRAESETLRYAQHGRQKSTLLRVAEKLQDTSVNNLLLVQSWVDSLASRENLRSADIKGVLQVFNYLTIIRFDQNQTYFEYMREYSADRLFGLHNALIRKLCLEKRSTMSQKHWKLIFNRLL